MKYSLPISFVIAVFLTASDKGANLIENLSNFFFIIGLIHLLISLTIIIRNGGLFKSLSYFAYKAHMKDRKHMEHSDDPQPHNPMTLYEFTKERYSQKNRYFHFLLLGITGMVIAQILVFVLGDITIYRILPYIYA